MALCILGGRRNKIWRGRQAQRVWVWVEQLWDGITVHVLLQWKRLTVEHCYKTCFSWAVIFVTTFTHWVYWDFSCLCQSSIVSHRKWGRPLTFCCFKLFQQCYKHISIWDFCPSLSSRCCFLDKSLRAIPSCLFHFWGAVFLGESIQISEKSELLY